MILFNHYNSYYMNYIMLFRSLGRSVFKKKGDRSNKIRKGKPKRTGGEDSVKRELPVRRTSHTA